MSICKQLSYTKSQCAPRHFPVENSLNYTAHQAIKPLVIAGPSGVGKGTIIKILFERFPGKISLSVSHTTRNPRLGEKNGTHYHFTQMENMKREISEKKFVEYAHVHGNYYGTSIESIKSVISEGKVCVLDIDVQGVIAFKKSDFEPNYTFIKPPNMKVLEERLRGRKSETEENIHKRLKNAKKEIEFGSKENFDLVLVNDDLTVTANNLISQLLLWYPFLK
mmetsp:Transcript_6434/g.9649  ORF Transcript_6434/g.9649 Transcript_6434/m.9649 type:complete len:222 (-) Transcript_6434:66-731(-)